jgi:hypothetical protein
MYVRKDIYAQKSSIQCLSVFTSFYFFVGQGFELRTSCLQNSHSIAWATPPVFFDLVILEMGVPQTISPGWISASKVARHEPLAPSFFLPFICVPP